MSRFEEVTACDGKWNLNGREADFQGKSGSSAWRWIRCVQISLEDVCRKSISRVSVRHAGQDQPWCSTLRRQFDFDLSEKHPGAISVRINSKYSAIAWLTDGKGIVLRLTAPV